MLKDWLPFLTATFMAVYMVGIGLALWVSARRKEERFDRFSNTLTRGLETGRIAKLQDCLDVARGIVGSVDDAQLSAKVAQWLRRFLVKVVSDQISVSQSFKIGAAKDQVSAFIRELEKSDPFSRLPPAERGIIVDIFRAVDDSNVALAHAKTHDLAGLIESRSEYVLKLERSNRWSIPLAVVGILVSLLFGFASIKWS